MSKSIKQLEAERAALLQQLSQSGDMRRGSITEVYRRCGKANCACAEANHPGHGPYYAYTMSVGGKTRTVQLRAGPRLSAIEHEVVEYKRFRATSERVIDVNEQICNTRWLQTPEAQSKKKQR